MQHIVFPRAVGHRSPRAETPTAAAMVREIQASFEAFRDKQDKRLNAIEAALDQDTAERAAARLLGGPAGSGGRLTPEISAGFVEQLRGALPTAGMRESSGPDGGFTVPSQIDGTIMNYLRDLSPLRGLATIVPQPNGVGSWEKIITRVGGGAQWSGELDERVDTDTPQLGKVIIDPQELFAVPALTNHVIDDSAFNLQAFIQEDVSAEFALKESSAFVAGDGIKKPRGFTTYDTTNQKDAVRAWAKFQHVATGTSGAFPASNPTDVLRDTITAMRPIYRAGPGVAWLMNSVTAGVVSKFKDGDGRYIWTDALTAGLPPLLMGFPVAIDESMPDIAANSLSIAFGNWKRGYAIVDRPGMNLIVDRVTKKGWTKLYFARRVGGNVLDFNAIKFVKFSAS